MFELTILLVQIFVVNGDYRRKDYPDEIYSVRLDNKYNTIVIDNDRYLGVGRKEKDGSYQIIWWAKSTNNYETYIVARGILYIRPGYLEHQYMREDDEIHLWIQDNLCPTWLDKDRHLNYNMPD